MRAHYSRIIKGFLSSLYGQLVTILFQLISVPVFLSYWGAEKYGEWLILFAIPTSISMLELGVFNVIGNKISNCIQIKQYDIAKSIVLILSNLFLILTIILITPYFMLEMDYHLLIVIYSAGLLWSNFYSSSYRAIRKYHISTFIINSIKLLEYIALIIFVSIGKDIPDLLGILVIIRIIGNIFLYIDTAIEFQFLKKFKLTFNIINVSDVRSTLNFSLIPLAFMLNNQGILFVINYIYSPLYVTMYSMLRTYFRLSNQMVSALTNSSWQELNYLYKEDKYENNRLMKKLIIYTNAINFLTTLILLSVSNIFFFYWSKNEISPPLSISLTVGLTIFLFSSWQSFHVYLCAINKFSLHAKLFLFMQLLGIFSILILKPIFILSLLILLIYELVTLFIVIYIYILVKRNESYN